MIRYEAYPPRPTGGQICGMQGAGIRGVHYFSEDDAYPSGIEAICTAGRSQHRNKQVVEEMIEWAVSSLGMTPSRRWR